MLSLRRRLLPIRLLSHGPLTLRLLRPLRPLHIAMLRRRHSLSIRLQLQRRRHMLSFGPAALREHEVLRSQISKVLYCPGLAWGCEADEECCTEGGADACYNPSSEQCCPGGSCSKDHKCCGNECCGEDYNCGGDGYCTTKPSPTTSRPTGSASAPTATRTITFRYDPDRKVPVQNGELYEAINKAVLQNMCEGIKSYLRFVSQSIELTRADASTPQVESKSHVSQRLLRERIERVSSEVLSLWHPAGGAGGDYHGAGHELR
jgi:hypothetical protein